MLCWIGLGANGPSDPDSLKSVVPCVAADCAAFSGYTCVLWLLQTFSCSVDPCFGAKNDNLSMPEADRSINRNQIRAISAVCVVFSCVNSTIATKIPSRQRIFLKLKIIDLSNTESCPDNHGRLRQPLQPSVESYIKSIGRNYTRAVLVMTLLIGSTYLTVMVALDRHSLQQNISFLTSSLRTRRGR